jgi:hypothetical protein
MFERLLEPGCTESPACQCGGEMQVAVIESLPEGSDAAVRVYRCSRCQREMRLTVWATHPAHATAVLCRAPKQLPQPRAARCSR